MAASLLSEFVLVLATYQEEGRHLFPGVFLTESMTDLLAVTGGREPITIGTGEPSRETVRRAFKQCGPLAEWREWAVFVSMRCDLLTYGIFRTDQSPLSLTPFERLRHTARPGLAVLGLTRLGGSFVEVRGSDGRFQFVNMTGARDGSINPLEVLRAFTRNVTRDAAATFKEPLDAFYYRVGVDILHANHGTLVAVIDHKRNVPALFDDSVLLQPRLAIADGISSLLAYGDNESFQRVFAWNLLLRRMTAMDGTTVFDSSGAVVAYNCFVRASALEPYRPSAAIGGARRRAFEILAAQVGAELLAVIYKSQDGFLELAVN